jgi:hypothetical protein
MLPYLALAGVQTTVFSAVFAFSERVFYPSYAEWPRLFGMSAIVDQQAAGAVMWVPGSIVLLIAICAVALDALDTPIERGRTRRRASGHPSRRQLDLLRVRWLGPALRSRRVRRLLQGLMLGLAAVIVADGLFGAQEISAMNLAGVLPWTYWRGFVVIGLLVLGNVFCAVCPFTLSRSLAGRLLGRRLHWPRVLGNKWTAVGLFAAYLAAYESFALWDTPLWTAWLVLGYFVVCFTIEGLFPRGTFCRHVCPIGQFNFVGAGVSPFEVQRIDSSLCGTCQTHDCLRGNDEGPGCPTGLFLPTKQGSLDCTFCLDCVRACSHDNAGLVAVTPGAALGTGRAPGLDVAALSLVFCFGAFANAAAMIAPVAGWERTLGLWLGTESRFAPLAVGLGCGLVVAPSAAALVCSWTARVFGRVDLPLRVLVARLAPALVPVGFSMWLAHFGFHLVTGLGTLGPAATRAASDAGLATACDASMSGMLMGPISGTLEGLQIAVLGAGLVVSIAVAWRLSLGLASRPRLALALAAPWFLLATALYGAGVWIMLQPMEMRGMMM